MPRREYAMGTEQQMFNLNNRSKKYHFAETKGQSLYAPIVNRIGWDLSHHSITFSSCCYPLSSSKHLGEALASNEVGR